MQSDIANTKICLNCNHPLNGKFCSNCGQDGRVRRLTVISTVASAADEVFKLELPLIRTMIDLMKRPGMVAAEYVRGRRRKYSNPLKLCLLITAISVILLQLFPIKPDHSFTDGNEYKEIEKLNGAEEDQLDFEKEFVRFYEEGVNLMHHYQLRYMALLTLLYLPLLAGLMRLFHFSSGYNFAENYTLGLYVQSQWTFLSLPLIPFINSLWASLIMLIIPFAVIGRAAPDFFPGNRWISVILSLIAMKFFLGFYIAVYIGSAIVYALVRIALL